MSKIVIRMAGGLANRMLQYTYGVYLVEKGYNVFYDNNYVPTTWKFEDITWNRVFPQAALKEASPMLIAKLGGRYNMFDKFRRHIFKKSCSVDIMNSAFKLAEEERLKQDRYLVGIFQSAPMVQSVEATIRKTLQFAPIEGEKNKELLAKIAGENAVAIHVRKGKDYLIRDYFIGTCPREYYARAYAYMKEHVENPTFYLFTDNPQWVQENLSDLQYTLVQWNPSAGWGNHFDMQLMASCKHNIISNSTYSWWGGFLNASPDKIVIGPKEWFTNACYGSEKDALLDDWLAF